MPNTTQEIRDALDANAGYESGGVAMAEAYRTALRRWLLLAPQSMGSSDGRSVSYDRSTAQKELDRVSAYLAAYSSNATSFTRGRPV